jgi:hypothetical protein
MSDPRPIRDTPSDRRLLSLIGRSELFRRRQKLLGLLEYLARETMADRGTQLTQESIAADVFKIRDEGDAGATVRTAVARLRKLLDEYARSAPDESRILIPGRRYYVAVEPRTITRFVEDGGAAQGEHAPKQITQRQIVGQQGINLIEQRCLEMGFVWHPTNLDAGIDGYIELRAPNGDVTNCIIQVQSKATTQAFDAETPQTLEYHCDRRDLDYWLGGNAPVILVRSRLNTNEAYWVPLKEYFNDPVRRKSGKVVFNKTTDRFDLTAKPALERLAAATSARPSLAPRDKPETIYSNLLRLGAVPANYFVATTEYRMPGALFARLRELTQPVHGEWILQGKTLTSFHDLSRRPWVDVIDPGTVETHDTQEWLRADDPARQRQFVQLLNACLKEDLFRRGVRFSRESGYYYFRASQDLTDIEYAYASREHRATRAVFKGYPKKTDPSQMSYYRHSAFDGRFVRYGGTWFLQVMPTYHFTRDGERLSRYAPDLLSGIKRLENNQAVHGQVVMWAHVLTGRSLFDTGTSFLEFDAPEQFELNAGLDDNAWLKHEDTEEIVTLRGRAVDERQQVLLL